MKFVLYAPGGEIEIAGVARLLSPAQIVEADNAGDLCTKALDAQVVLIATSCLSRPLRRLLVELGGRRPRPGVVLVWLGENRPARVPTKAVDSVVRSRRLTTRLAALVHGAVGRSVRRSLVPELVEAPGLPPALRLGLVAACKARIPFRTVAQMADAAGCGRVTLTHQWSELAEPEHPRLVETLGALSLVDAVALRRGVPSWEAVAEELRLSVDTLRRRARRSLGLLRSQLATLDPQEVLHRVRLRYLDPVIRGPDGKELP